MIVRQAHYSGVMSQYPPEFTWTGVTVCRAPDAMQLERERARARKREGERD